MSRHIATNAEENAAKDEISFCPVFRKFSKLGWFTALSYTFSTYIFLIGFLTSQVNANNNDTNTTDASDIDQAAATLIMTMLNSVTLISLSPLFSISRIVSGHLGELDALRQQRETQRDQEEIEEEKKIKLRISATNRNGMILSAALSTFSFLPLYFSSPLLQSLGQDAEVSMAAQGFLRLISWFTPMLIFQVTFEQIILSFEKVVPAMVMGLSVLFLATLSACCLGFGWIWPAMGLSGIAASYGGGMTTSCIAYGVYLASEPDLKEYQFFNFHRLGRNLFGQIKQMLGYGWPITVSTITEVSVGTSLSIFAGIISQQALARFSTAMQFFYFIYTLSAAFGQAGYQLISKAYRAKNHGQAHSIAKYGLATTAIYITPICIGAAVAFTATSDNNSLLESMMFPIIALAILFDTLRYGPLQMLRPLLDNVPATAISAVCLAGCIGLAAGLGIFTELKETGLSLGYLIGTILAAASLIPRLMAFSKPENLEALDRNQRDACCCSFRARRPTISTAGSVNSGRRFHEKLLT